MEELNLTLPGYVLDGGTKLKVSSQRKRERNDRISKHECGPLGRMLYKSTTRVKFISSVKEWTSEAKIRALKCGHWVSVVLTWCCCLDGLPKVFKRVGQKSSLFLPSLALQAGNNFCRRLGHGAPGLPK